MIVIAAADPYRSNQVTRMPLLHHRPVGRASARQRKPTSHGVLERDSDPRPGIIAGGFLCVAIGYMESYALAAKMGQKHHYHVDPNQELMALGTANLVGSFFQSYPVTGSFSR